jgi:hypothetical protein
MKEFGHSIPASWLCGLLFFAALSTHFLRAQESVHRQSGLEVKNVFWQPDEIKQGSPVLIRAFLI